MRNHKPPTLVGFLAALTLVGAAVFGVAVAIEMVATLLG